MAGKGTIAFDVLCSTDEIENLCTVKVTATKAGATFDKSFDFAPGTTSTDLAGYWAKALADAGFTATADGSQVKLDGITKLDGGASKGRQVKMTLTGETGVTVEEPRNLPDPKSIKITRATSPGDGVLVVYASSIRFSAGTLPTTATIRVAEASVTYSSEDTAGEIITRLQAALDGEGWTSEVIDGDELEITKDPEDLDILSLSLTTFPLPWTGSDEESPNDDHWAVLINDPE